VVVVPSGVKLVLDGPDVNLFLIDHDHHLPLVFVFGDSAVS
jgi:hypothetical protein